VQFVDEALKTSDTGKLKQFWEYIKDRHMRVRDDLTTEEKEELDKFVSDCRNQNTMILSKGSLEAYLPIGYRSKGVDKLIRFTELPDFWSEIAVSERKELELICEAIKAAQ
jgi:putative ATP-dependent endonuclease of the OLD family